MIEDKDYTNGHLRAYSTALSGSKRVSTFEDILVGVSLELYLKHPKDFAQKVLGWEGRKRKYFSRDPKYLDQPKDIADSGIFVETKLSANDTVRRCRDLLERFDYSRDSLSIELVDSSEFKEA